MNPIFEEIKDAIVDGDEDLAIELAEKVVAEGIDPALEKKCKMMEEAYIRRLAQTRLEPTIPLNPPPTPKPLDQ